MSLTRSDIVEGLRNLGVCVGDKVLVHSSLTALGQVEGGADTVIDALLEAVGTSGLIAMPTFACKAPFDRKTSATALGVIADKFWRRPDAVRSFHPTHSVAAVGNGTEELIKDHEKAPTAYAEGTPYHKLALQGGKILLLGVDQDRNTTLHTAEALAGSVYLKSITATYIDDAGNNVTIPIAAMAGPHRDFIGMDRLFRECGIMRIEKIGKAVCRLIETGPMLDAAVKALKKDPAAVLCNNPACNDCVMQRGKIKAARFGDESFTLAAVVDDISDDPREVISALRAEGISAVEISALDYNSFGGELTKAGICVVAIRSALDDKEAADLAKQLDIPLIVPANSHKDFDDAMRVSASGCKVIVENAGERSSFFVEEYSTRTGAPKLAFNPARFAAAGEKPFLQVFYKGVLRKQAEHFYIDDGTFDGSSTLPGMGNGEVKEIISMLRCRGYDGIMTLRSYSPGISGFRQAAAAFWNLLDTM